MAKNATIATITMHICVYTNEIEGESENGHDKKSPNKKHSKSHIKWKVVSNNNHSVFDSTVEYNSAKRLSLLDCHFFHSCFVHHNEQVWYFVFYRRRVCCVPCTCEPCKATRRS